MSACAKAGIDLFFCSPEHQKMVWQGHKLFCGPNAFPFSFPLLSETEASDIIASLEQPVARAEESCTRSANVMEELKAHLSWPDATKTDLIELITSSTDVPAPSASPALDKLPALLVWSRYATLATHRTTDSFRQFLLQGMAGFYALLFGAGALPPVLPQDLDVRSARLLHQMLCFMTLHAAYSPPCPFAGEALPPPSTSQDCKRCVTALMQYAGKTFGLEYLQKLSVAFGGASSSFARPKMAHSLEPRRTSSHRFERRATAPACTSSSNLYTHPQASDTLPVYEDITLEWNPGCVTIDSSTVDLYLSVEEDSGWLAVHEWTNVQYAQGKLDTQLKPGWWNASTGAGQVSAQDPSLPSPTTDRNYPSVTQSAASSNYTGPSVESVADPATKSSSPSGGKLGAAIAVPLLVVGLAVAGYVTWHKLRKRPEKKRFSAVVDHRMSMISQGTWQPRPSMAGSRPGSFHPSHRPSGSQYTAANRQSYFADPNARHSTYSFAGSGVGVPSPLGAGIRQPPPAEMRQTGSGERMSRVSFAAGEALGRPSFASQARPGSVHTRSSLHQSQLRNSTFFSGATEVPLPPSPGHSPQLSRSAGPTFGSSPSIPRSPSSSTSLAVTAPEGDYFSRSGTREELASIRSPSNSSSLGALAGFSKPVKPFGHAHKTSVASSLRNELSSMPAAAIVRDGRLAYSQPPSASGQSSPVSPFGEHTLSAGLPSPALSSPSLTDSSANLSPALAETDSSMPRAFHDSHRSSQILSPDEALASYARDATSPTPGQARGAAKGGLGGFLGGWRRAGMMRSLTGGSIASVLRGGAGRRGATEVVREEEEDAQEEKRERERAKSPFEDPEEVDEKEEGVHAGLELELGESVGYAEGFERSEREKRDEIADEKSGHAL
ncbi:Proteophosphoglycan 5 [Rhodotorula toruloides]|nr:Proteophosphoglycan 5 [Rhodotorula toruloides]